MDTRLCRAALAAVALAACAPATAPLVGGEVAPPPYDVGIEAASLTQSVQDPAGSVPLLRGRPGLVRVFLRAREADVPAPEVTVQLVETTTGAVLRAWTAASPLTEVPRALVDASPGGAWSVEVAGDDVQPGRHLVAALGAVAGVPPERVRGTLRIPADGSLDVRSPPALAVTIVPVVQGGLAPDVERSRTAASWLDRARRIHPLGEVDVRVGASYATSTVLGADGSGWGPLLAELDRKRVAEGSGRTYLGAVHVPYTSGVAGRGDVRGRTFLAWDAHSYQRVVAHELGHNFGLRHAPCGAVDAATLDPAWPAAPGYAGGRTGAVGWDALGGLLKDPAVTFDLMGYCGDDATTWTSDHNYLAAMAYLGQVAGAAASAPARPAAAAASLLVSGTISGEAVALDAPFVVASPPPAGAEGPYTAEVVGPDGAPLAAVPFTPVDSDGPGAAPAHFAVLVPLPDGAVAGGVVVRRQGLELARVADGDDAAEQAGVVAEPADGGAVIRWDGARHREAMIRDGRTGEVLAFGRGGAARVRPDAAEVEVVLSGIRRGGPVRARVR
ncbi:MAG TPA: hypothetical protein VFP65_28345 [Anaeromyxobacteraceae bacterium]|nr:hypothetical protein [Anaeromyxobacteraceae bacterium]